MKNESMYRTINNGVTIPSVGFGTDVTFIFLSKNPFITIKKYYKDIVQDNSYHIKRDMSLYKIVSHSVENGCYLYDTAHAYGRSEWLLGKGLKHNKRTDYFVCTKVSNEQQRMGDIRKALESSLNRLKLEYVDLYLLHWPHPGLFQDSWKQMEELYELGKVRAIGVCNFHQHHLEELKKTAKIMPMINQFECHPLLSQENLRKYCMENNIQVMAYTPTGRMDKRLRENEFLRKISKVYGKSVAQVIIRWHIQHNNIPIINTTKLEHLVENMSVYDFELKNDEMKEIDAININCRLRYDPDTCDYSKI